VLPLGTKINVNTASAVVLSSLSDDIDLSTAESLVEQRNGGEFLDIGATFSGLVRARHAQAHRRRDSVLLVDRDGDARYKSSSRCDPCCSATRAASRVRSFAISSRIAVPETLFVRLADGDADATWAAFCPTAVSRREWAAALAGAPRQPTRGGRSCSCPRSK
jgi:hypothetical protein